MSENNIPEVQQTENEKLLSRRKALVRLGLAVGVSTYVAPLLTQLNEAKAADCPPGYLRSMGTCVHNWV